MAGELKGGVIYRQEETCTWQEETRGRIELEASEVKTRIKRLMTRKTICFSKSEEMDDLNNWIIH